MGDGTEHNQVNEKDQVNMYRNMISNTTQATHYDDDTYIVLYYIIWWS